MAGASPPVSSSVLLLAPQLVGYVRLACLAAALGAWSRRPQLCLALSLSNFVLDALDGYLARRLGQATAFGAFLDVLIDNASRAVLWTAVDGPAGIVIPLLEMTVFTCTQAVGKSPYSSVNALVSLEAAGRILLHGTCLGHQHE